MTLCDVVGRLFQGVCKKGAVHHGLFCWGLRSGSRFFGISLLSQKAYHLLKSLQSDYLVFSSVSLVVSLPRQTDPG